MSIDGPARYRLLLSLKSEAAMGLRSSRSRISDQVDETGILTEAAKPPPLVGAASTYTNAPVPLSGQAMVAHETAERVEPAMTAKQALIPPTMKLISPMNASLPIELPVLSTAKKKSSLGDMNSKEVSGCTKCRLHLTRTQTVFGEGDPDAKIFFIGEGPGENEDQTGRPFVGRAGQLLDKMISAMGITREQVFIANIVKCRPPENRVPAPDEVATCTPYLVRQLEIVRPKVIVTLGLPAVKYMLESPKITMGSVRGQWKVWRGIKLMPTYHPSYVLRAYTDANRQAVWGDLQLVMKELGLEAKRSMPTK